MLCAAVPERFDLPYRAVWRAQRERHLLGDESDPDGDGLPNLVEYGVGGSPLFYDALLLPAITTENGPGGEDLWRMTYRKSKTADGVVVEPQISGNLVDWTALTSTPTGEEDAVSIEFSAAVDRTGSPRQFCAPAMNSAR